MNTAITRSQALALLQKYNQEPFHILHALTVEGVMRWYATELGFGEEVDFWGLCGLLHDVDFEKYPEQHCQKAPELLSELNAEPELVHAICSHGYGLCSDVRFIPCGHLAFPFLRQRRQRSRGREADGGNGSGKIQK